MSSETAIVSLAKGNLRSDGLFVLFDMGRYFSPRELLFAGWIGSL